MEDRVDALDSTDNVGEENYEVDGRKEEDEKNDREDLQDNGDDDGVCHEERADENGQSFRFDALAEALRCHKLAAAALTIPHTLSIAEDSLSQLRSLRNVLIVPPASAAVSTNTRCLRFHLVNMIIHQLSRSLKIKLRCNLKGLEGIGLPVAAPGEAAVPQSSRYIDSLLETTRARLRRSLRQAASSLSRTLPRELLLHFRPHGRQTEATVTAVEKDDTWEAANSELRTEIGELGEMAVS
ncbi:hypothetical protein AAHC03_020765 [Spirometra sp. Aus1]